MHSVMPDPPEEFINLASSNYNVQGYPDTQAAVNDSVKIKAGNTVTVATTERKLVPILKTPPTVQRSSYNVETHGNIN